MELYYTKELVRLIKKEKNVNYEFQEYMIENKNKINE